MGGNEPRRAVSAAPAGDFLGVPPTNARRLVRTVAPRPVVRRGRTAIASALALNLVPLVGVMVLGWSAFAVALFYWLRCCVIGLVALVTMADRPVDPREGEDDRIVATVLFGIVFSMALAFGLLGVVFVFAGRWHQVAPNHWHAESAPLSDAALLFWLGLVALQFGQGVFVIFRDRESIRTLSGVSSWTIAAPAVFHAAALCAAIIIGGLPVIHLGSPLPGLVLLVVLATVADLAPQLRTPRAGNGEGRG